MKRPDIHERHIPGSERHTARLEAFSDGVFSIAITLFVLEFRVPPHLDPRSIRKLTHIYVASVTVCFFGIVVSLFNYKLGLRVSVGLMLFYLLPPLASIYLPEEELEQEHSERRVA